MYPCTECDSRRMPDNRFSPVSPERPFVPLLSVTSAHARRRRGITLPFTLDQARSIPNNDIHR